jgi:single-stranded-DNA-specific exonuclease
MDKLWQIFKPDKDIIQTLSSELGISLLVAQALINRGIKDIKSAEVFLNPRLRHLKDPMEIPNILTAAKRVLLAKERKEKVLVFGDYDVDGVTGTAIMLHTLNFLRIEASYYIPHRYGEGYGLSIESVKKIAELGVKLIITVDCGIASVAEVEVANSLGMDVIITDHHNLPKDLPRAHSIVNPKMISKDHPSKHLSGAGVAFKFVWALLRIAEIKESAFLTSLLDLVALGTISDVVPLTAENRIFASVGLGLINERKRLGIKFLAQAASLENKIAVSHIYYTLAPRINAAGRLEHASKSLELLLTQDPLQAKSLAEELSRINTRRQGIGSDIKEQVFGLLDDNYVLKNSVIVLSGNDWHPGVVGIVASQVADQFYRPAILIGINDGVGRGSARSVEGVNIFALLDSCRDLFTDFGGHEGAAGFEIDPKNIAELQLRLEKRAGEVLKEQDLIPKIIIDAELNPSRITLGQVRELDIFDPYGEGNPRPVFMSRKLGIYEMRKVGAKGKHLKIKFMNERVSIDAIGFNLGDLADRLSYNNVYDIAYKLEANEWNGFETAQLNLVDIREYISAP